MKKICDNPNCDCENCDCENCDCYMNIIKRAFNNCEHLDLYIEGLWIITLFFVLIKQVILIMLKQY